MFAVYGVVLNTGS